MKRTYHFVKPMQWVECRLPSGRTVTVPVVPGILKHPTPEQLPGILARPAAMEKYTLEALRKAAWPILEQFPRSWLRECLDRATMRPSRRKALTFLLS
jgi:hypothetical protein